MRMSNENIVAEHVLKQVRHARDHVIRFRLHRAVIDQQDGTHTGNILGGHD
jgi:hypothetical protein